MMTMCLSCTDTEIRGFKDFGVRSLTFWDHVKSSVTWPLDSAYVVSYCWSIGTMRLSCTVTEILGPKDFGVTTLTFWGHVTLLVTWPSDSAWALSYCWSMMTLRLSCTGMEIQGFKLVTPKSSKPRISVTLAVVSVQNRFMISINHQ